MNALLLPGNSPRHAEWIEALKLALAPHFERTETQHYKHWQTGGDKADFEHEISTAERKAEQLEPYIIIAKSIGTAIAARGVAAGQLKPKKLILLGVPLQGGVPKELFLNWLEKIDVPVVFVQNTSDPLGSFAEVQAAFAGSRPQVSCVELPGETHDYLDFAAIARII